MPNSPVLTVCLPKTTPAHRIADTASALLAAHAITGTGPIGHFRCGTRLRSARLLQPAKRSTAGGPIGLLDLTRMRTEMSQQYGNRWQLWQQIVAGSPAARSWWQFHDRHHSKPGDYSWHQAWHVFTNQPRVARMLTYNSHPGKVTELPLQHLDAFEAGLHAYATYGWLQAVPGHRMLTLDGALLHPASARYSDQLDYLGRANEHIAALDASDVLVAIAIT